MPTKSSIGQAASAATQAELATELATLTVFSKREIESLFPNPADRQELSTLIDIVKNASNDNDRKAKLIGRVGEVAGALVQVTKKVATGVS